MAFFFFLFFFKATYEIYRADICITHTLSCRGVFLWLAVLYLLWAFLCWKAEGSGHALGMGAGSTQGFGQGSAPVLWKLLQFVGAACGSVGLAHGCQPRMCHPILPAALCHHSQQAERRAGQQSTLPMGTSAQGEPRAQLLPSPAAPTTLWHMAVCCRLRNSHISNVNIVQFQNMYCSVYHSAWTQSCRCWGCLGLYPFNNSAKSQICQDWISKVEDPAAVMGSISVTLTLQPARILAVLGSPPACKYWPWKWGKFWILSQSATEEPDAA